MVDRLPEGIPSLPQGTSAGEFAAPVAEILQRVQRVLDEQVRPLLRDEGGDLEVVGIDQDRIVQVRLLGACHGCPGSVVASTMMAEKAVKAEVPEVRFLEAVL